MFRSPIFALCIILGAILFVNWLDDPAESYSAGLQQTRDAIDGAKRRAALEKLERDAHEMLFSKPEKKECDDV